MSESIYTAVEVTMYGGRAAYINIPADTIRKAMDGTFPYFAKSVIADSVSGAGHRWVAGHDLLLDVPRTLVGHGPAEAFKQFGHIVLTDFPTKSGIPIPGFSMSGLGQMLIDIGIPKGYLSLNIYDASIGIFAVAESSIDLFNALNGNLLMSTPVFFNTFIAGGIELAIGFSTENPLMLIAGFEDIATGCVATFNYYDSANSFMDFFGIPMASALAGFLLSVSMDKNANIMSASINGAKSFLLSVSSKYGIVSSSGCMAGILAFHIGKIAAERSSRYMNRLYAVSEQERTAIHLLDGELLAMLQLLCEDNKEVGDMIDNQSKVDAHNIKLLAQEEHCTMVKR